LPEHLSQHRTGGLGRFLMHKLMDKVEHAHDADGNSLTMSKRLKPA
jgi:anti-sigma regulatory factor (Ser/Thr protein kinase)